MYHTSTRITVGSLSVIIRVLSLLLDTPVQLQGGHSPKVYLTTTRDASTLLQCKP